MQLTEKAAGACAAVALVAAAGCAWFLFRDAAQPVAASAKTEAVPPTSTTPPAAVPPATPVTYSVGIQEPAVACAGEPWEAQPGDPCGLAMDYRFSRERVIPGRLFDGHGGWRADWEDEDLAASRARTDPAMPMWRDVFGDAETDRVRAEAALADPTCAEGRTPLGGACAPDAVAAAGLMQEACVKPLAAEGVRNPWIPPGEKPWNRIDPAEKTEIWRWYVEQLDADPDLTTEEYWKKRRRAETAMYRYAWRVMRCATLPESVLSWFGTLPTPTGEVGDDTQAIELYRFASRHGVEWAEARQRMLEF
ncbi:MAG: hypothetical protein OXU77_02190 [Gammaproteobacteria bacterium]|nr:hypothetical protein [Gammaproteobacteria bacterium]MDE0441156.1 hypothetical protein [Gammaproteobacteria bacterium]